MNKNLKRELKSVFEAPAPVRKSSFLRELDYPKESRFDFIKSQAGYIRKRVWILSVLIFIFTLSGVYFYKAAVSFVWVVSSVLPFISLTSIIEIVRSTTCNMDELEMSCKHSLSEITFIRLAILGTANLIVLCSILFVFMRRTDFGFLKLGLYLVTPFLLNCYGSLFVINRLKKSWEITYVCGCVTAFVSTLNVLFTIQANGIYTDIYRTTGAMLFIILVVLTVKEIIKLFKKTEELHWNSTLTA